MSAAAPSAATSLGAPSTGIQSDAPPPKKFIPPVPGSLREAGLTDATVEALVLKYLLAVGSASGGAIARELCLPNTPVLDLLSALKQQQIIGYVGAASAGDFTYVLTEVGRDRARRYMLENTYFGAAPVPIENYIEAVLAQSITHVHPRPENLRNAFSDLLINEQMFATLGPAINSGRGMFLYGYPGNGKTSIAERITRCFGDDVFIPRVVTVDGMIIKLFDPENHEAIETPRDGIFRTDTFDGRWIKIRRPTIVVGGELTMESLEVQYNPTTKICEAPFQMKSNTGTFVIDDFGRQRMRPIELLNRWIVPLEKRFDFLVLPNGKKVRIPFDQLIIFSTNLEPKDLVDDAFLRRIPYKINVSDPSEEEFRKLFDIFTPKMGFQPNPAALNAFIEKHYKKTGRPFRCCQPRDILLQIRNLCLYQDKPLELTPEYFDFAASMYFTVM